MAMTNNGCLEMIRLLHGISGAVAYNTAGTYVCIGTGTTAFATTDTKLAAEVIRKKCTSVAINGAVMTIVVQFASAEANNAWNEWGIANSATKDGGMLLNRVVKNNGTKVSGQVWDMTITITLNAT